jgi:hypothetical protein
MSFIYKTINHQIYVAALDIENTEYLHGSFKYKDSARRWAAANSNPNVRPLARIAGTDVTTIAALKGVPSYTPIEVDNTDLTTGAAIKPSYPEPTQEMLDSFYAIHGDGAEYKINPDNGWPMAV